ncbi:hypothetical protein ACHQM5_029506 [Ranunculus cassubicifolius]
MKIIIISALFIVIQLAAAATESAEKCGSLGVMSTDNLPVGVNPAEVRKCADHPFGHKRIGMRAILTRLMVALVGIVGHIVLLVEQDIGAGLLIIMYSCGQKCKAGSKACGCSCDH